METIHSFLNKKNIKIAQMPFFGQNNNFFRYPLYRINRSDICKLSKEINDFPQIERIYLNLNYIKKNNAYKNKKDILNKFKDKYGKNPIAYTESNKMEYKNLIEEKKSIKQQIDAKIYDFIKTVCENIGFEIPDIPVGIRIINIGLCNSLENLNYFFNGINGIINNQIPVFTYNINQFKLKQSESQSAIEGGPCLFGADELILKIYHKNGSEFIFDLMTEMSSDNNKDFPNLNSYMIRGYSSIKDIKIIFKNNKITLNTFIELYRLFQIADIVDCPLLIGLPDSAYKKFFFNLASGLKSMQLFKDLEIIIDTIVDNILNLINLISKEFPRVEYNVFHSRNINYINKLKEFQKNNVDIYKNIRIKNPLKRETIIDFISLPLLPKILFNINNILEVNNILEFESIRYIKNNYSDINISCLAFPLLPNKSDTDSMFHSSLEEKFLVLNYQENHCIINSIISNNNIKYQMPINMSFSLPSGIPN